MILFLKRMFNLEQEVPNGVLHRAHTTLYEDLCQ